MEVADQTGVKEEERVQPGIEDLPLELLENILYKVSNYDDLDNCQTVCKSWKNVVRNVVQQKKKNFCRAVGMGTVQYFQPEDSLEPPPIGRRSCPSARLKPASCYFNKAMYVFGGHTTAMTTFNDIWKFDLSTCGWHRLLAGGSIPTPCTESTLCVYKSMFILFGGWTPRRTGIATAIARTPINSLHTFSTKDMMWTSVLHAGQREPAGVYGHTATIMNDSMFVFGGCNDFNINGSTLNNKLWELNLERFEWTEHRTGEMESPDPRQFHMAVPVDGNNILICGGNGGKWKMRLMDAWQLCVTNLSPEQPLPCWKRVGVSDPENSPLYMGGHSYAKTGNFVIMFGKDPDAFSNPPPPQLAHSISSRHSSRFSDVMTEEEARFAIMHFNLPSMQLHVLNLSEIRSKGKVAWTSHKSPHFMKERANYTMVEGRGEILVYGGIFIKLPAKIMQTAQYSQSDETAVGKTNLVSVISE